MNHYIYIYILICKTDSTLLDLVLLKRRYRWRFAAPDLLAFFRLISRGSSCRYSGFKFGSIRLLSWLIGVKCGNGEMRKARNNSY